MDGRTSLAGWNTAPIRKGIRIDGASALDIQLQPKQVPTLFGLLVIDEASPRMQDHAVVGQLDVSGLEIHGDL